MTNKKIETKILRENISNFNDEEVIDLTELFHMLLKHLKLMIGLAILFGTIGYFATKLLIAPTYTASTSIYLGNPQLDRVD